MKYTTTVVIPNYNGAAFLRKCMDSLAAQTYQAFRVLVVDNGSADECPAFLKKLEEEQGRPGGFPRPLRVIFLPENTGFSGAVNLGIREADTPYVILLNNDVETDPFYVAELVRMISASDRIFSASPKMIQMYHPELMDDAGDMYSLLGWAYQRGVGRSSAGYRRAARVFSGCAGASIYRREVFSEIGLFDEMHFAYLEDLDVGYRARIYGYENVYCPRAKVFHVGSGTSGSKYNSFKVRLAARNNVYLNYKNMPYPQLLLNLPFLAAGTFVKSLFFRKLGYGTEYAEGLREGLRTAGKCRKVHAGPAFWKNYIRIQGDLVFGTVLYIYEFCARHLAKRKSASKISER